MKGLRLSKCDAIESEIWMSWFVSWYVVEVIGAFFHTEEEIIYHETALFKISSEHLYDENIQNKLKFRRAHIIAITERYFVIEASGLKEDIDKKPLPIEPLSSSPAKQLRPEQFPV